MIVTQTVAKTLLCPEMTAGNVTVNCCASGCLWWVELNATTDTGTCGHIAPLSIASNTPHS